MSLAKCLCDCNCQRGNENPNQICTRCGDGYHGN